MSDYKQYELLCGAGVESITAIVSKHLCDGWKLHGVTYSFISSAGTVIHYQAMVR